MESIEQLNHKFLEEAKKKELQEFCEKQHAELIRVLGINKNLQEENDHLKKLLMSNDSMVIETAKITPEELICIEQIAMLKVLSETTALTLEECRRLDTYVKLMRLIRGKEKAMEIAKEFKSEDLLRIVEVDEK